MKEIVIGIDVGGTNIKLGAVKAGKIIAKSHLTTQSFLTHRKKLIDAIVNGVKCLIQDYKINKQEILGIGIGLPGLINPEKGIVQFLPNVPGWKNVPLKKIFQQDLEIPTFIENDVNMIALGEWRFGAGVGVENLVCITLGTGVGGGLILNNSLYRGEGFVAGEIGHMPLNEDGPTCNCGGFGCLERYVGSKYLLEKAIEVFKDKNISLEKISVLAKQHNQKAVRFWEETGTHIGNGLIGVVNLLNPKRIVIGGGVSNNHRTLFKKIEQTIRLRAMKVQGAMVKVVKAKLGNDAGILGAQVLVKENNINALSNVSLRA